MTNFIASLFAGLFPANPNTQPVTVSPPPLKVRPRAMFSFEQFKKIFPNTPDGNLRLYYQPIIDAMQQTEINNKARVCAFLAQVGHETGEFMQKITEENLYYTTASRLPAVFGSAYFAGKNLADYTRNPEKLANLVYANKGGNGNTASGEGWKYRGRGIIQLTLKNNYKAFADWSGVDVISNPDLLLEPKYAVLSATHYWMNNGLNALADKNDFDTLTSRINRAKQGMPHRKELLERAKSVII